MNKIVNKFLLAGDNKKTAWICLWTIYKKQRKNTKIKRNRFTLYLLK